MKVTFLRCVSQFGFTSLIMASNKGHLEIVEALMAAGANMETKGDVSARVHFVGGWGRT